jgi:hypothetical protein
MYDVPQTFPKIQGILLLVPFLEMFELIVIGHIFEMNVGYCENLD